MLALLGGLIYHASADEPAPLDADLLLFYTPPPPGENGYLALLKAGEVVTSAADEVDEVTARDPLDPGAVSALLRANQGALTWLDRVPACARFGHPDPEGLVAHTGLRELLALAAVRGRLEVRRGRLRQAADRALELLYLGHRLEHARGPLISCMIGRQFKQRGLELLEEALAAGLSPGDAGSAAERMVPLMDSHEGCVDALRLKYTYWAEIVERTARGELDETLGWQRLALRLGVFFKPHKIRRLMGEYYRYLINLVHGRPTSRPKAERQYIWDGNLVGRRAQHIVIPYRIGERGLGDAVKTEESMREMLGKLRDRASRSGGGE